MQTDVDKVLRNLGVLAQIKQHDKLLTEGEHFAIYVPTAWRSIYRYIYSEAREQNMLRVAECVRQAKSAVTHILSEHSIPEADRQSMALRFMRQEQLGVCQRIMCSLTDSMVGLDNLMQTYRDDAAVVVRIQHIKGDITDFLANTQTLASSSPIIQRLNE